jgi:hypothetical protein
MSVDIQYYSFAQNRADDQWSIFEKAVQENEKPDLYTPEEWELVGELRELDKKEDQLQVLMKLDVEFGSVSGGYIDGKAEGKFILALFSVFNLDPLGHPLQLGEYLPTKKDWVYIFSNFTEDILAQVNQKVMESFGWGEQEAWNVLHEYLSSVRPVAKDLKGVEDSVVLYEINGEFAPDDVEATLLDRAQRHREQYESVLNKKTP